MGPAGEHIGKGKYNTDYFTCTEDTMPLLFVSLRTTLHVYIPESFRYKSYIPSNSVVIFNSCMVEKLNLESDVMVSSLRLKVILPSPIPRYISENQS